MRRYPDAHLVDSLVRRCPCSVRLRDGRTLQVTDIAWGYDLGDDHAHVTTNISPGEAGTSIAFFFTCELDEIVDGTGPVWSHSGILGGSCSHCG